jgi:hypothetical protein
MTTVSSRATASTWASRGLRAALVLALALLFGAQAPRALGQTEQSGAEADALGATAMLGQCVKAVLSSERSVTFAGEMARTSGSARMAIRIDVQARMPGEALFHTLSGRGLGVWRGSDTGVRTYRYVKQVTNLAAPAFYRGTVRFRWLNAKGRVIKHLERHTPVCAQPAALPNAKP